MIAGDRVAHVRTDAPGEVTHAQSIPPWLTDDDGPWAHVQFDDGLACWCPISALLPEDPAARRTTCGHAHYAEGRCAEMSCANYAGKALR